MEVQKITASYDIKSPAEIEDYNDIMGKHSLFLISTQFLIEKIIQSNGENTNRVSDTIYKELLAIAFELSELSLMRESIQYGTASYYIEIHDDHSYEFKNESDDKITNFMNKSLENDIYYTKFPEPENSEIFHKIDKSFSDEFGLTFTDFFRLFIICISFLSIKQMHTVKIKKIVLIKDIRNLEKEWVFTRETLDAFFKTLSISRSDLSSDFYPTHIRTRNNRLVIRPFVVISENKGFEYVLNPWVLLTTFIRWYNEICTGYLPYKDDYIKKPDLRSKLIEIRQKHNREF